ncbi:tetratricopeptide repeat protein [Novosphingobium sp. Leaf2]|uniref:tetratricopeptide repeat protein n=1 Tax=Novosphingobium sp. Leaf2 TaxID=1735670 RepID=UPI0009ECAF6F|nr:tetratricopeptide repeat protein [Novosphingobium sp. Leaf2]
MRKSVLTAIAMNLAATALPVLAETAPATAASPTADADMALVQKAAGLIAQKQSAQALTMLAPMLTRFDAQIAQARSERVVFCGPNAQEALLYLVSAAQQKRSAVVLGPEVCEAYFTKSYALVELGRKAEALAALEQLTALAPKHAHYFIELGFSYRAAGQNDKAMAAYRAALDYAELAPDDASRKQMRAGARRGIGYMLVEQSDLKGAREAYQASLQDDPDSPVAKSELAFIQQQQQQTQ